MKQMGLNCNYVGLADLLPKSYKIVTYENRVTLIELDTESKVYNFKTLRVLPSSEFIVETSEFIVEKGYSVGARTMPISFQDSHGHIKKHDEVILPPTISISPNRKNVLWIDKEGNWVLAKLADRKIMTFPRIDAWLGSYIPVWFADSEQWGEFMMSGTGKTFTHIYIHTDNQVGFDLKIPKGIKSGKYIGTTSNNQVILLQSRPNYYADITDNEFSIINIDLGSSRVIRKRAKFNIPDTMFVIEAVLSTNGSQIAWLLETLKEKDNYAIIAVSDTSCSNVEMLCNLPIKGSFQHKNSETDYNFYHECYNIDWDYDDSSIYFIYNNLLCNINTNSHGA